jgi:two-component system, cell cycle sensor histidine kinase and response regulator CckA
MEGYYNRMALTNDSVSGTDRMRMAQLRNTLEQWSAVITASPAAIVSVSPEGTVMSWNAAAERLFGWTAAEAVDGPLPFVPEESRAESGAILDRALRGETVTGLELQRKAKDGRTLNVSLSIAPLRDTKGATTGVMGVLLDVSAQRRAERVLEESERRFRAAFEQAAVGMAHVAFDGSLLRVNRRLAEIAGYPIAELTGSTLSELTVAEDREVDGEEARRLRDGAIDTYAVEKRLIRGDGVPVWIKLTFSAVRSEDGEPLHLSAVIEDVDERLKARYSLAESERKFRSLVENAPEGIYIRTGTEIHYANRMALRYFGADSEADLCGRDVFLRFHPDFHDSARDRFRRLDSGEVVAAVEEVWVRMDGSTFDVEVSAIPYDHERQRGALVFFRDITARKEADRERKSLTEQFYQSQKLESIGRLAGGVAHDFNNHLTVINGYCSLLLGRLPQNDPSREILEQVLHAGERSADLIRQLLSFSRKQVVEPRATDVAESLRGLRKLLERLIGEDILLCIDVAAEMGAVYIDPGQLNQIIMNLAVNARDAMPDGGTLRIETSLVELGEGYAAGHPNVVPGNYLMIAVSDTGHGMDEDTQSRIFEPFFTTKGETIGTGLGLSTVYGIVRQAGGWIWVYSEAGKGSTFKVYLPRIESAPSTGPVELPKGAGERGGRETILVVEDQEGLRKLTVAVLKKLGYEVWEACDGYAALSLCAELERPIDLLLTDVIMPGMTGRVLAQHLMEAMPGVKVLYMSGYTANVITDRGVLEPGLEYLAKPFTPEHLGRKVRSILDAGKEPGTVLVIDDQEGVRGMVRDALTGAGFRVFEAADGKPATGILRDHPEIGLVITDLVMPEQEGLETIRLIKKERPELKVIAISGAFDGQFLRTAAFFGADATMAKPLDPQRLVDWVRGLLTPPA